MQGMLSCPDADVQGLLQICHILHICTCAYIMHSLQVEPDLQLLYENV